MDIAEFLLARIAEDEAVAREAVARASVYGDREVSWKWLRATGGSTMWEPTNHDPARVLTECDAKRRIVEDQSGSWTLRDDVSESATSVTRWGPGGADVVEVKLADGSTEQMTNADFRDRYMTPSPPSRVLRLLAEPYADHPDYQPAWSPLAVV